MADFTRSVELIFGGKDNVTPTIKNITRSLDEFDTRVSSIAAPVGALADSILKIDAAVIAVGGAMLAFSIGEAIRFESATLDLQKVLGDTEGSVDQYKTQIKELSLEYGVLATDTTASVAEFKQASFSIADSLTLVESSLIAVKISELDASESSDLLKRTLIGFNLEAENSADILDTWNESSNNFNTNTREIATGLADLAPVADLAGLSLDETASLLIPIIERFGSGTEAAKALKTALLNMVAPSTTEALAALGISQREANGEIRNAADILRDVQVAYQNLTPDQQLYNTGLLVGKNQAARLTPILSDLNGTLEVQSVLSGKAGSAMDELAVRMQATEVAMDRLKVAFNAAQESIGTNFIDGVKGSTDELTNLFVAIGEVVDSGGLAPLFNAMQPLFAEFEKDIAAIAKNLPEAFAGIDFSGLVKAFEGLGGDIGDILDALFGDFDIETVEGLETVLQGTVEGLTTLINVTRGIFIELKPIFEAIGEVVQNTGQIGEDTEIAFGRFLGAGKLINDFGVALGAALLIVNNTSAQISNVFDLLIGSARVVINILQIAFDTLALTIVETFRQLNSAAATISFGDVSANFRAEADELQLIGNAIEENLARNVSELGDSFVQAGRGIGIVSDEIETNTKDINTSVKTIAVSANEATDDLNTTGKTLEQVFLDAGQAIDPVSGKVTTLGTATAAAANVIADADEKTGGLIETLVDGVPTFTQAGDGIEKTYSNIGEGADAAKEKTDDFLIKMEEIASNERIKNIEASVNLNIAQLETDAKVAVSIIETLSTTISSTGELLGSLFGNLEGAEGLDAFAIRQQIDLENERRQQALDQQKLLIDAQVRNLEARTDALRDGDGLITITADGLEPELEAFMMAVLSRVQIKAAEDQALYLLGLPEVA